MKGTLNFKFTLELNGLPPYSWVVVKVN